MISFMGMPSASSARIRKTTNPQNLGICIAPQEFINQSVNYIIAKKSPARSALHYRINTTEESERIKDHPHVVVVLADRYMRNVVEIRNQIRDPLLGGRIIQTADRTDDGTRIIKFHCDHKNTAFALKMRWG
ncbi:MAG: hypothetical protein EOO77_28550 [Oxalobacteraceae bacterium]|nr:MAG: hypothetical protein EOO77_28550 [Oxalobacteraceae bacterium]